MWNNQVELSKSEGRLDEQFCVLGRLSIRTLNEVLIRIGSEDLITEGVIETAFKEWQQFKERPDRKSYMLEWFLGKELSSLPPPPVVAKQEENSVSPSPEAEGPHEFGGDYATQQKGDERNEAAPEREQPDSGVVQEDEVPKGQDADRPTP